MNEKHDAHVEFELQGTTIEIPPEGLTVHQQARWWMSKPTTIVHAKVLGLINQEVWDALCQIGKDTDLAHKVVDSKKVPGLTREERDRLFAILTDGGDAPGGGKGGRRSKLARNMRIAIAIEGVAEPRERNRIVREMAGDCYGKASNNISKILKEVDKANEILNTKDREKFKQILEIIPNEDSSEEALDLMVYVYDFALKNY
jgi:hypothetical protein